MERHEHKEMEPGRIVFGKPRSLWMSTTPETDYQELDRDLHVNTVVIGGGICGLTTATLLKDAGATVAVVENGRIAAGVSGNTTAKITSQHGLIYDYLISEFGSEKARLYADANQTAIERIAALVGEKNISCDFQSTSAYVYATSGEELTEVKAEARAAESLGLPAIFVETSSLPFSIRGAVRFSNQAQFHPRKYLLALAEQFTAAGGMIFENTRALDIKEAAITEVVTDKGIIRARNVIIASHSPFYKPSLYSARMYPKRSYVLGIRVNGPIPQGMYYSVEDPYHSIRTHPLEDKNIVLVGGQNHKTGHHGNAHDRYEKLASFARDHFDVESVDYRWSTQDNVTMDRVPYIGKASPLSENVYVATGFGGWGMTHSMVSAMIFTDAIMMRPNPWSALYNPNRLKPDKAFVFIKHNVDAAGRFVKDHVLTPDFLDPNYLTEGDGGVISSQFKNIGVAKDREGVLHVVSPNCTHMGCVVSWNDAEESWDCPCHGSRFAPDGRTIQGPAVEDLKKESLDKGSEEKD